MMARRSRDDIEKDLRNVGRSLGRNETGAKADRAKLTRLYVEGARAGLTPAAMADLSGAESGSVRRMLSEQRKAGAKIDHAQRGPRSEA
jgi:hypothetical protein